MTDKPWMPLYVAEYLADTAHLSAAESGAYLHLIMHYWLNGGLPKSDEARCRIARMLPAEWRKSRATIAAFFTKKWTHKRVEAELKIASEVSASNSKKARDAANARWLKHFQEQAAASMEQCSEHAPSSAHSISGAMLQNAPSQKKESKEEKKEPSQETNSISRARTPLRIEILEGGRS